jgi:hypothetical protein
MFLFCSFFRTQRRMGRNRGMRIKEIKTTKMDVLKMLAELRHEREQIEEAILTLERLSQGRTKRRGRPPAWMATVKRRGRPPGSKNKVKEIAAA